MRNSKQKPRPVDNPPRPETEQVPGVIVLPVIRGPEKGEAA